MLLTWTSRCLGAGLFCGCSFGKTDEHPRVLRLAARKNGEIFSAAADRAHFRSVRRVLRPGRALGLRRPKKAKRKSPLRAVQ